MADVQDFLKLPGGKIAPAAAVKLNKASGKGRWMTAQDRDKARWAHLTAGEKKRVLGKTASAPELGADLELRLRQIEAECAPGGDPEKRRTRAGKRGKAYKKENRKVRGRPGGSRGPNRQTSQTRPPALVR